MTRLNSTKSTEPNNRPVAPPGRLDGGASYSLRPWKGLFLVALAWILFQGILDIWSRFGPTSPRPPAAERACAYILSEDGEVLGTALCEGPRRVSELAAQIGVKLSPTVPRQGDLLPCDRIVELDRSPDQRALEPISGRTLLALGVPLDVNTARAEDLEAIRGIGPKLASRIVANREKHGPYKSMGELGAIDGIGAKKLEAMIGLLEVKPEPRP